MAIADVEALREQWRTALDAAEEAVKAATALSNGPDLRGRGERLRVERDATGPLLNQLAHDRRGFIYFPMLLPPDEARRRLKLPPGIRACVFGLDGVLMPAADVHARAWKLALDELLERHEGGPDRSVVPFDPVGDYRLYIHGRPRLDGIRGFLASRGISLPEGAPDDPPGADTVHGVANRKLDALSTLLEREGPRAYDDTRGFLELVCDARILTAVHSSSEHAAAMLEHAGLSVLVDVRVVADERLRPRPTPDRVLAACRLLGIPPEDTAAFDTSTDGVFAARAAGCAYVVAVERHPQHVEALLAAGADAVVASLGELYATAVPSAAAARSSSGARSARGVRRTDSGSRRSRRRQAAPERRQTAAATGQTASGSQPRSGPPTAGPTTEPRLQDIDASAK